MTTSTLDALVIGGGPAGATTAALLGQAGWSVGLIERSRFPRRKVCGEYVSATNLPLLRRIGVADAFLDMAGPAVTNVGLFSGDRVVTSDMPAAPADAGQGSVSWGRALGRDQLDTMLLERAVAAGARVWQPWNAIELRGTEDGYRCLAVSRTDRQTMEIGARIIVAAHGSWEPGPLPTQSQRPVPRASDLFGFKAHFHDSQLPTGLMPLVAFPGGYGGMVHCDHGRLSLSCCIRRDQLERARRAAPAPTAGAAVLAHVRASCRGAREALVGARLDREWLSAGPIRPGIRRVGFDRVFVVGNAAGEAHPVVAEGIGMAMQSASLLCVQLTTHLSGQSGDSFALPAVDAARRAYEIAWRREIVPRIRAAALIGQWAMRPAAVSWSLPLLERFPGVLTAGARLSGKVASTTEAFR